MGETKTRIDDAGSIFLPVEYRKLLGLKPGDEVVVRLDSDEIRIVSSKHAIRRAQTLIRKHIPAGRRLVDELIRDRRAESERGYRRGAWF